MKKKVVSKEALEAMYAGKKSTEEPAEDPKAEANLEPGANVKTEPEVKVEPKDGDEVNFEEKFTALSEEFDALKEDSEKSVLEAEAKLAEATSSTETLEATITSLKEIELYIMTI